MISWLIAPESVTKRPPQCAVCGITIHNGSWSARGKFTCNLGCFHRLEEARALVTVTPVADPTEDVFDVVLKGRYLLDEWVKRQIARVAIEDHLAIGHAFERMVVASSRALSAAQMARREYERSRRAQKPGPLDNMLANYAELIDDSWQLRERHAPIACGW